MTNGGKDRRGGAVNLLQRTGQLWKIYLFMALLLLGCAATLLQGFLYEPLGRELAMQIGLGGVAMIAGGFFWAGQDITCPQCRLKLFYHAFRHQGFLRWFGWLLQVESCPKCGHGEQPRSAAARKKGKGLKRP
jgi:hypothetical protein